MIEFIPYVFVGYDFYPEISRERESPCVRPSRLSRVPPMSTSCVNVNVSQREPDRGPLNMP
jgi:hypothetical protein